METFDKILWGIAIWTCLEGGSIAVCPTGTLRVTKKLFSKWGTVLEQMDRSELRQLGGIELIFGLFLGGYLWWAA